LVRRYSFALILIFIFLHAQAQNPQRDSLASTHPEIPYTVGEISIKGNRITKAYIIKRELLFQTGDKLNLTDLVRAFVFSREQIIKTHLFNDAVIYLKGFRGYTIDIQIDVKERWYIFPLPYVRPVDRNLTAWSQKNYSLSRLDYGLKYAQYNFTGRNDNLQAWFITGYSRQIDLSYDQPYADKSLKHGFGAAFSYVAMNQMDVFTLNNQQYFIDADTISYAGRFLSQQWSFSLRYYFRPALKTRHFFRLGFSQLKIDSAVTVWNPHYLDNQARNIFYPEFSYVLNYNDLDYTPYPLHGILLESGFVKRGIDKDMNLWQINFRELESWKLARKLYFGTQNLGILKFPFEQPFLNEQMFGYGDFYMRGLEKYVIEGVAGGISRNTFMRELLNFNIPFLRGTSHDLIPVRIFAKVYGDCGYIYNKYPSASNNLTNSFLYSGGFGLDLVTFYDLVFRFECSFNQFGEKGFFFHVSNYF
jgi:outer membrane protein assembly factor BamA